MAPEYTCDQCGRIFSKDRHPDRRHTFCCHECRYAFLRAGNSSLKKDKVDKVCPVCGTAFAVKPSAAAQRFCSFRCKGLDMRRKARERIESQFDAPLAELLRQWYTEQGKSVRQIVSLTGCGNHTILRWLDECGVPKRKGGEAVAMQWINNDARRKATSAVMKANRRRGGVLDLSGDNSPMRRPEMRKHFSDMRKGAGNPMYNRSGPDSPSWKGGKILERGNSWARISKEIRARDGNRCVKCGSADNLQVHHIVPYRETQDNSPENLVTLCGHCHPKIEYGLAPLQLRLLNGIEGGTTKANRSASARDVGRRHGRKPAK